MGIFPEQGIGTPPPLSPDLIFWRYQFNWVYIIIAIKNYSYICSIAVE